MQNHAEITVIMQDYADCYAVISLAQSAAGDGQHHTENIVEAPAVCTTVRSAAGVRQTGGRGSGPDPGGPKRASDSRPASSVVPVNLTTPILERVGAKIFSPLGLR